jgi:hypothetical protein
MSMKLAVHFNEKAKVVKCENDIKVGMRTEADGSKIAVRGGKVISRYHQPKAETKDMDGRPATHTVKLNQFRREASDAVARKHKAARFHRAPSSAPAL